MGNYIKMCVASGLNYYRKVPDIRQLIIYSGMGETEFWSKVRIYSLGASLVFGRFDPSHHETIRESAIKMIMKEKYGKLWIVDRWCSTKNVIKAYEDELKMNSQDNLM